MGLKEVFFNRALVPSTVEAFMEKLQTRNIRIDWAIEAGCHSGADTLRMARNSEIEYFFLFEPDPVSFEIAKKNLLVLDSERYSLFQLAVSNIESEYGLVTKGGLGGEGSLITNIFGAGSEITVKSCRIDSKIEPSTTRSGLLWLDVEGFAIPALEGATTTLNSILVIKIEVEYANMNEYRSKNFSKVLEILNSKGFILQAVNLNPCYFGDLLLIHKSSLGLKSQIFGKLLTTLAKILQVFIYPLLRKPGYL